MLTLVCPHGIGVLNWGTHQMRCEQAPVRLGGGRPAFASTSAETTDRERTHLRRDAESCPGPWPDERIALGVRN